MPCSPGMKLCKRTCLHRKWVDEYNYEYQMWEIRRGDAILHDENWVQENPPPLLRDWMKHREAKSYRSAYPPDGYGTDEDVAYTDGRVGHLHHS